MNPCWMDSDGEFTSESGRGGPDLSGRGLRVRRRPFQSHTRTDRGAGKLNPCRGGINIVHRFPPFARAPYTVYQSSVNDYIQGGDGLQRISAVGLSRGERSWMQAPGDANGKKWEIYLPDRKRLLTWPDKTFVWKNSLRES